MCVAAASAYVLEQAVFSVLERRRFFNEEIYRKVGILSIKEN